MPSTLEAAAAADGDKSGQHVEGAAAAGALAEEATEAAAAPTTKPWRAFAADKLAQGTSPSRTWTWPRTPAQARRLAVFADLHSRGYSLSAGGGAKFGGDLLAYPPGADPSQEHAAYVVRVVGEVVAGGGGEGGDGDRRGAGGGGCSGAPPRLLADLAAAAGARVAHSARKRLVVAVVGGLEGGGGGGGGGDGEFVAIDRLPAPTYFAAGARDGSVFVPFDPPRG